MRMYKYPKNCLITTCQTKLYDPPFRLGLMSISWICVLQVIFRLLRRLCPLTHPRSYSWVTSTFDMSHFICVSQSYPHTSCEDDVHPIKSCNQNLAVNLNTSVASYAWMCKSCVSPLIMYSDWMTVFTSYLRKPFGFLQSWDLDGYLNIWSRYSASPLLLLLHPVRAYNEQSSCYLTIRGSIPLSSSLLGGYPLIPCGKGTMWCLTRVTKTCFTSITLQSKLVSKSKSGVEWNAIGTDIVRYTVNRYVILIFFGDEYATS